MNTAVVGYGGSEVAKRALAEAPVLVPGNVAGPVARGCTAPLSELEREHKPEAQEVPKRALERARQILANRRLEVDYVAEVGAAADRLLEVGSGRNTLLVH